MAFAARVLLLAVCVASAAAVVFKGNSFHEDFVCEVGGQLQGVCAERCTAAGGKGASCGVTGRDLRCCPSPNAGDDQGHGQRSWQICRKYAETNPQKSCPDFRPFKGSNIVELGEYPYSVAVGYETKDGKKLYSCGGALISDRFVLTTAVCAKGSRQMGIPKTARVGDLNLKSEDDDGSHVQEVEVTEVTSHPQYEGDTNHKNKAHDLALLRLARPVVLNQAVQPACLYPERRLPESARGGVVAGYGRGEFGDETFGVLRKVDLEIPKNGNCSALYEKFVTFDDERMICAGSPGKDTCQGDSGSALAVRLASPYCNYAVVGISSFGPSQCGKTPGVYTRLYPYLPWIENVVWSV